MLVRLALAARREQPGRRGQVEIRDEAHGAREQVEDRVYRVAVRQLDGAGRAVDEAGNACVCQNSLDAVSDRDFAIEFTAAAALIMRMSTGAGRWWSLALLAAVSGSAITLVIAVVVSLLGFIGSAGLAKLLPG